MTDGNAYRGGKVHVLTEQCSTCVFRAGNLMHLQSGRLKDLVESNRSEDTALTCHQTLEYGDYDVPGNAICRGYFDAYGSEITPLRMAQALEMIELQEPPTARLKGSSQGAVRPEKPH